MKQDDQDREKRTIGMMIEMYCVDLHHTKDFLNLCDECGKLLEYALKRLEKCPHQPDKPTCAQCATHCYQPRMRERILRVMRHSGPRMLFKHPLHAILHSIDGMKRKPG